MEKLNELIEFYEMTGADAELLVLLLELRRHRTDNWKQRAEAAEAELAEEKQCNSKLRQDRADLARECNAFEAKLAEMENQEPVAYLTVRLPGVKGIGNARRIVDANIYDPTKEGYWSPGSRELHSVHPLYARPATAIKMAELVPAGWKLVPVEPTEEMNKAGWAAMNEHDAINPTYRAMLAAAPVAP